MAYNYNNRKRRSSSRRNYRKKRSYKRRGYKTTKRRSSSKKMHYVTVGLTKYGYSNTDMVLLKRIYNTIVSNQRLHDPKVAAYTPQEKRKARKAWMQKALIGNYAAHYRAIQKKKQSDMIATALDTSNSSSFTSPSQASSAATKAETTVVNTLLSESGLPFHETPSQVGSSISKIARFAHEMEDL